ncbi:DUF4175 family protein [Leeuwenhoekiella sp. A16]|uniref:DUF4175 family protein n=1 Tax=unclassified Leeuwenhoekiella TaxID=2615029 RepID=UPI003A80DDAB
MSSATEIERKIEGFISKYYKNQLLRGVLFFVAIGLSYLLLSLTIEYFFWLRPLGRAILFWLFIGVEAVLFFRLIVIPVARLFKIMKGIDVNFASEVIGKHFPEVSDKLINTLQLKNNSNNTELALASIEQKSRELMPVPFSLAVDYKKSLKYIWIALLPLFVFLVITIISKGDFFGSSYTRMVNYDQAYEPPAPFNFFLNREGLKAIENEPFVISVNTQGKQIPADAQVVINGSSFFMKELGAGQFTYTIEQPVEGTEFYFVANEVKSGIYDLKVVKTPLITDFEIELNYPTYTGKPSEIITNTGNVTVAEGTEVNWKIKALSTGDIKYITKDTIQTFRRSSNDVFKFSQHVYTNSQYTISTSNADLANYESLDYNIAVIKDQYPDIQLDNIIDTTANGQNIHYGRISDDYGLTALRLVYYNENNAGNKSALNLNLNGGTVDQFVRSFPDTLSLNEGESYAYYFEVYDNDAIHNHKVSRSEVFTYHKVTNDELEESRLQEQGETIQKLDKSLSAFNKQQEDLERLSKTQKEKGELSFNDKQELKGFLQRQEAQDNMMKEFSKQLDSNLQKIDASSEEKSVFSEELQKRLEANEKRLEGKENLLKELKYLQDKISKEELSDRLDDLAKSNKNSAKSLEQLLELTKRFYVQKKVERVAKDLNKLGQEQIDLSKKAENNNAEAQEKFNESFEDIEKKLADLQKESEELKAPIEIPQDVVKQESIKEDQKEAQESLEESEKRKSPEATGDENKKDAEKSQKSAGEKMKQLSQQMQSQMMQSSGEQIQEDADMLRQILDNLIIFSFEEESLMNDFKGMNADNPQYSVKLVKQNDLRENFQHIDDSLFALSLRTPQLEDVINEQLTNIDYNIDKSLERLAENRISQGAASQQYVVSGANVLADVLSDILGNMQQQLSGMGQGSSGMPAPGQGKGGGMQLSDIIQSQEELNKMGEGQDGKGKGEGEGDSDSGEKGGEKGSDKGEGSAAGESGQGNGGSGNGENGMSEEQKALQYEIYKRQESIKQELLKYLQENGLSATGNKLVKEMENIENRLLESGVDDNAMSRMLNLKHKLLELENAAQEQGKKEERESSTNQSAYQNNIINTVPNASEYFQNKEILNREAIPMRTIYDGKVQAYFKKDK